MTGCQSIKHQGWSFRHSQCKKWARQYAVTSRPGGAARARLTTLGFTARGRLRLLLLAAAMALGGAPSAGASVVKLPASGDSQPRYLASATREIGPGDYVHTSNPICGNFTGEFAGKSLWDLVEVFSKQWQPPVGAAGTYAGPVLRPDSTELLAAPNGVQIQGDVGRLLSGVTNPAAACVALAVVIPRGAIVDTITYEAAENSEIQDRAWRPCEANVDCLEGWSKFESARQYQTPSGAWMIAAVFKNWANDRARRARLNVYFFAPEGWEPPPQHTAELALPFPSEAELLASEEAVRAFAQLLPDVPPVEMPLVEGSPWHRQVGEFLGLSTEVLSRVSLPLRSECYTLERRLRGLTQAQVDKMVEHGLGTVLVPGIPSYSRTVRARTVVSVASDFWFAARSSLGTGQAEAGPRWLPPGSRPIANAIVRSTLAGASGPTDRRILSILYDDFFLRDLERLPTIEASSAQVVVGGVTVVMSAQEENPGAGVASAADITQPLAERLRQPGRSSRLYVLDNGWPTSAERARAFAWLGEALRPGLPNVVVVPPGCGAINAVGQGERHPSQIAAALDPFEGIDPMNRVDVIYLPMTNMQCGSDVFLKTLIAWSYHHRYPSAGTDEAQKIASDVVERIHITDTTSMSFHSDRIVLDSYLELLDEVHLNGPSGYFLNGSWYVEEQLIKSYGNPRRGFIVAAVGNRGDWPVFKNRVEFAGRALDDERVLAVTCQSSLTPVKCHPSDTSVAPEAAATVLLLRFDGLVGNDCGTSFACPRIAWLLAAADATRLSAPPSWSAWVRRLIRSSRTPLSPDFSWAAFTGRLGS